jgi:hypothetical protein
MWFLALLVSLNALLNNETFVNKYRLELGVPINIFDILILVGFVFALLRPKLGFDFLQTDRIHNLLIWMMPLFLGGLLMGMAVAMGNDASFVRVLTAARNLLCIPACIYIGYFLTSNFRSARWFLHVTVLAGVIATFMIIFFFKEKGESMDAIRGNVVNIRAVAYVSSYAGLAVGLLFYSLAAGRRLYPLPVTLLVGGWCVLGSFFTLSRSDWIATLAGLGVVFLVLPRERLGRSLLAGVLAVPVLIVIVYAGLWGASVITRQDMVGKMYTRVETMLPGYRAGVKLKAWDTRVPGMIAETKIFLSNPIMGGGLSVQDSSRVDDLTRGGARHCSWTATAAEQGILGLAAACLMIFGTGYVAYRMTRTPVEPSVDPTLALLGALGVVACTFYAIHGMATMSWNQVRYGMPLFVAVGVVLRSRAMQLHYQRAVAEYEADLAAHGMYYDEAAPQAGYPTDEPVFGNWYQTN